MAVEKIGPANFDVRIKFGGGLHTRAPEDEIQDRESADGINFDLDAQDSDLRNRKPFDLLGTAPNLAEIRGGGSFRDSNGVVHAFVQAGDTVFEWDGQNFQASPVLDTINASARLRGHWRSHYWALDDLILVTDLEVIEPIKQWDGLAWADVAFTNEAASGFGPFAAKYLSVSNERAIFSNTADVGTFPHLIVGSKRSDYTVITVNQRPSSALNELDPFFLVIPDLRAINGHVEAFGVTVFSTEEGRIFNLTGQSAQDFAVTDFYPGSAAAGVESLVYIGTDIIYGRQGRVESVKDTDRFGDTEADDLTVPIADEVRGFSGWTNVYNSRLNRVYMFPSNASEVWVFDTAMRGSGLSPWMRWTTQHALAFQPTFVMSMLDPLDGLEYIFMGDASGNFYRLEGTGTSGDGGTTAIKTEWLTRLFSAQQDAEISQIEGYIKYRKKADAAEITLQLEYSGESLLDEPITVVLPATISTNFYGGGTFYGGGSSGGFYGVSFRERLARQLLFMPGGSNEFQLRLVSDSAADVDINEIGLRFVVNS